MDNNDLELGLESLRSNSNGSQQVRKRINIKLKPATAPIKEKKPKSSKLTKVNDRQAAESLAKAIQLTTLQSGLSVEPLHKSQKLRWDHKVNLLGDKIMDPLIHTCEDCNLPILIYGRVLPCKHVFCFKCASESSNKVCQRCREKITRVEQCALGTVFVCTFGGTKHGKSGCHRTYLSNRDLQSHMQHRHTHKHVTVEAPKDIVNVSGAVMHMPPTGMSLPPGTTYVTQQTPSLPVHPQQVPYRNLVDTRYVVIQQQPQPIPNSQIIMNPPPSGHHIIPQHTLNAQPQQLQGQLNQSHLQPPQNPLSVPQSHIQAQQIPQQHIQQPPQAHLQQPPQAHLQQPLQGHLQQPQGHMQQPPQNHMPPQGHLLASQSHIQGPQNQMQMPSSQHPSIMQSDLRQMPVMMQQRPSNLITVPLHDENNEFPRTSFHHDPQIFSPTYIQGRQPPPQSQQFQRQFMPQQTRPIGTVQPNNFVPRPIFEDQRDQFGQIRSQPPNWQQNLQRNLIVQQQPPPQMRPTMSYYR